MAKSVQTTPCYLISENVSCRIDILPAGAPAPPTPEVADEDRFIVAPDMEGDPEDSMPSD